MGNGRNAKKLTREEKEKAVELAIDGKDPIGYLKECGCKNPWASWAYIKNTLKKSKPELYAKLPSDDDRLDEEVSYGAQAALAADPPVPADDPEAADPLEGFTAFDPGAPEGDRAETMVIKADDLAAAEDPAVEKMEKASGIVERSTLIHDARGVRMVTEQLLDDLPCAITGLKVNEFEFNLNRAGMVLILPESDRNFLKLSVTLTPDQWKRLVEVVPKVMKVFGMDK